METCNPLLEETEEGDGEEEEGRERRRRRGGRGAEMAGDMWDGGLEGGDFAGLRQFITGLSQAKWRCWGGVGWSRVKNMSSFLRRSTLF